MLVHGMPSIFKHLIVDGIDTACNGLGKTSPPDNGIEDKGDFHALKFADDEISAEFILVCSLLEMAQFLDRVAYRAEHHWLHVLIDGNLSGGRAGVYDEYIHRCER